MVHGLPMSWELVCDRANPTWPHKFLFSSGKRWAGKHLPQVQFDTKLMCLVICQIWDAMGSLWFAQTSSGTFHLIFGPLPEPSWEVHTAGDPTNLPGPSACGWTWCLPAQGWDNSINIRSGCFFILTLREPLPFSRSWIQNHIPLLQLAQFLLPPLAVPASSWAIMFA